MAAVMLPASGEMLTNSANVAGMLANAMKVDRQCSAAWQTVQRCRCWGDNHSTPKSIGTSNQFDCLLMDWDDPHDEVGFIIMVNDIVDKNDPYLSEFCNRSEVEAEEEERDEPSNPITISNRFDCLLMDWDDPYDEVGFIIMVNEIVDKYDPGLQDLDNLEILCDVEAEEEERDERLEEDKVKVPSMPSLDAQEIELIAKQEAILFLYEKQWWDEPTPYDSCTYAPYNYGNDAAEYIDPEVRDVASTGSFSRQERRQRLEDWIVACEAPEFDEESRALTPEESLHFSRHVRCNLISWGFAEFAYSEPYGRASTGSDWSYDSIERSHLSEDDLEYEYWVEGLRRWAVARQSFGQRYWVIGAMEQLGDLAKQNRY